MNHFLTLEHLSVTLGSKRILDHIDATFGPGITAVVGPNGSGKTTLLNAICGLIPFEGEIRLHGVALSRLSSHQVAGLGLVRTFQTPRMLDWCSVTENAAAGLASAKELGPFNWHALPALDACGRDLLRRLGLPDALEFARGLSFGERKLVELARAASVAPDLLLLDEPVSGLHDPSKDAVRALLQELTAAGTAIVLVEHDLSFVSLVATRSVALVRGRVMTEGPVATVIETITREGLFAGAPDA